MPSLNTASYIREAIDSALAQTHPVLEVIVVDGGSKDGARELAAGYGEPFRLVDQSRTGRKGIARDGILVSMPPPANGWLSSMPVIGGTRARSPNSFVLWQSLAHWPFPTFLPVRYKAPDYRGQE